MPARRPPTAGAAIVALASFALLAVVPAAPARTIVRILDDAPVHATPGGAALVDRGYVATEHGSAWVLRRSGDWLQIPTVKNRKASRGWIRRTALRPLQRTRMLVRVDLSGRRVRVTHGGRLLMSASVGVGGAGSPSPIGATSVAERIAVTSDSGLSTPGYGPVVIALRMWQPLPSAGLPLGGIMAFHGTRDGASIGTASSAGCFRMHDGDARRLARLVRAGTPVIIRR